jgi:plastocyanin
MRRLAEIAATMAIVPGVGACGSSSSHSSGTSPGASSTAAGQSISEAAKPSGQLKFVKPSLSATAGKVTIHFVNMSSVPHNLTIQPAGGGAIVAATPTFSGASKTLTLSFKPGAYTFYCSVLGHRAAGMHGILRVH